MLEEKSILILSTRRHHHIIVTVNNFLNTIIGLMANFITFMTLDDLNLQFFNKILHIKVIELFWAIKSIKVENLLIMVAIWA